MEKFKYDKKLYKKMSEKGKALLELWEKVGNQCLEAMEDKKNNTDDIDKIT